MAHMTPQQILTRLSAVFQDVFDDDQLVISQATTADDIEAWDSIMHVNLVLAVEKEFGVQMSAAEVGELDSVGSWIDLLAKRLAG